MRLEKVVLDGFKSFADKTEFAFDASVTAIVGPNGCGKSNVVDAVKWVLGEQKVKSLRSDQMADVIFGGSTSRKPHNSAEVTLVVSNLEGSPGRLPIDADHVQISRRIYRNGECEYRINNNVCRLKDVRELFMDTGVGTRAYSIIEQGQIEQLVSASKTDRRIVFEEAAGISKYKAHKKEALRRLEHTEQNLLRLADILSEVAKSLRSVKLQAGKARSYLEYNERLKQLQVNYSLAEYAKIHSQQAEKQALLASTHQNFARLAAELAKADAEITSLGNEIIDKEHKLSETSNSLVAVQSKIDQHIQRIEFLRSRIVELDQRQQSQRRQVDTFRQQKNTLKSDLSRYKDELAACEKALTEKNQLADQVQKNIHELETQITSIEADLEDEKSGIIDIVRRTAQLHNEIRSISDYRNSLSNQVDRLTGRAKTTKVELEKLFTEKAQHNARLTDIEKVLAELQQNLESKRKKIEEIEAQVAADGKRLARNKEARSAISGELTVLADMERRYEGVTTAVKTILENQKDDRKKLHYVEGILADKVTTDVQYSAAVEAALEGNTDALLISDANSLLSDKETADRLDGRVAFLRLDKIEPFVDNSDFSKLPHVSGRLVEFVNYPSKYASLVWKLLGRTILVDSIEYAIEMLDTLGDGYKFVSLKGDCMSSDGLIRLGPVGKAAGLISRKSRMRQLEDTITGINTEIATIEAQIQKNTQTNEHLARLCKDLRTAVYEANTEKVQAQSKLALYDQQIEHLREEEPLISGEIDSLQAQIAQSVQKEYDSKQKLQELEAINNERSARIAGLEEKSTQHDQDRRSLTAQLMDLRVELGQITEQAKALRQMIEALQNQIQANLRDAELAEQEMQNCDRQIAAAQGDILSCEATVSELYLEKDKSQQNNKLLHSEIQTLLERQKQTEQLARLKRDQKTDVEQKINDLRVELGQLDVKQQDLAERVRQELQIDLAEAYKTYNNQVIDWNAVSEEIMELRGKIERLGNVNIDAIDEQKNLEERHDFLSTQVEDLTKSKAQLQQLIARLNKISREKFIETFEQIRTNFQQIFRKLFGGGKADIVLEESDDVLEAGIEVIARPPGKETRSISLLSGGEKSMTALALLFAVFRTKPSPFCFLDEVDAALDEANNERFDLLLKEFQKDTQFIVITHAKRTMSIADVLLGITMQAQGVSKKIAVRFDEYEDSTAAA